MKRIFFHLQLIVSLLCSAAAFAAPGATPQEIYTVDIQRVIDQSIVGKAARADLQTELKKREAQLSGKGAEIEKMKADLQKQASLLAGAALAERQDSILKRERDFAQERDAQRDEMARKTDAQMKKLLGQIDTVLSDIAKDKDNALIVEQDPRLVLYADPRLDLTDQVVKRLNDMKLSL